MNLKEILHKKAEYPVRLIAKENGEYFTVGDNIGIEVIDFSIGNMRVVNKDNPMIFELYYNKNTWEIEGDWDLT